jgi:hypothetical protein
MFNTIIVHYLVDRQNLLVHLSKFEKAAALSKKIGRLNLKDQVR